MVVSHFLHLETDFLILLIGELKEQLLLLKIKDNVEAAGLFHPLVLLRELGPFLRDNLSIYQSNNWLIVLLVLVMAHMDAVAVKWREHLSMLSNMVNAL